jgi:RimJ/RimL family protein N-acetyltransferase
MDALVSFGDSIEESRSWLEIQVPAFEKGIVFEFAIVSSDGRYLGGCGLNQLDQANSRANLGYWSELRNAARRRDRCGARAPGLGVRKD